MRNLLALALLLLLAPAAHAQSQLAYTWCIDLTVNVRAYPLWQFKSGTSVWMRTTLFRVAVGHFTGPTGLTDCTAYMQAEIASNFQTPDQLVFTFSDVDLQGNAQQYSWDYAQLSPVPDAVCTQHYFS